MEFSKNLKNLRVEMGKTQKEFSVIINVSRLTISHWENGYSEPSISQLIQLADLFSVTLDELVGRE